MLGFGVTNQSFAFSLFQNWITTSNNNCNVHNPSPVPNDTATATWSGECKDGYVHGYGMLQWYKNGKKIGINIGEFNQGERDVSNSTVISSSEQAQGNNPAQYAQILQKHIEQGQKKARKAELEQKAKAEWTLTETYQCKVRNIHSNHTAKWSGGCQDGYVEGMGTLEWYKDDKLTGTYVGSFSQGNMQGKGVYTWADGSKYDGEYKDNKKHGKGIDTWANGSKYDGEYKDGQRHGLGKLTLVKGDNGIASYDNGEWQGDTYIAQGEFVNGKHTLQCEPNQKASCDKARAEQKKQEQERKKQEQERREREYKANIEACKSRYVGERLSLKAPYRVMGFIFYSTEYKYLPFKVVGVGKDKMTVEAMYDGSDISNISSANISCNATSVR